MGARRGGLRAQLRRLTLPLFLDLSLVMLIGVVDTLMLSRQSDGAVAAVGMVNQLMGFVFLAYQVVSTGAAILCAQYYGAGERRRLVRVAALALGLNAALGAAASAALYLGADDLVRLMGLDAALRPEGAAYLRITGALSLFQSLTLAAGATLRSCDRVVGPMAANIVANAVNAAGNYALIFGRFGCPALGVEGAAWATAAARGVALLCLAPCLARLLRDLSRDAARRVAPPPWLRELARLVRVGTPAVGEEMSYCLSQVAVVYFVNRISTEALATKVYCTSLIMFVNLFICSLTQGGDILVGHLVGRHRYLGAYRLGNYVLRTGMAVTLLCGAALAAAGPFLLRVLTDNAAILRLGAAIFALDLLLDVGRVKNIFACWTLRAAGDVVYPVVVGVTVQWTVGVGVAWLLGLPLGFGLLGVWVGFTLDENLRGVILLRRWHSQRWRGKALV